MPRSVLSRARSRRPALVASVATLAVTAGLTVASGGAASSVPLDDTCPAAYPVGDLVKGQHVSGLTVSDGDTPDTFDGSVLGVLKDGIAPGIDMIMVRLNSTAIDDAGGIWQGMSGSPVYSDDDKLIGAVAYGLTWGASPIAGVTPAADMQALLDSGAGATPRMAPKVALPRRTADSLVARGTVTQREADSGLSLLPTPLAVSGMSTGKRLHKATKRLGLDNVRIYRAGSAPSARVAPSDAGIVPGGNLAASLSYGDFSAVGTGTVTMVCGQDVVGFGHPFDWTGDASLTMHNADALFIQEDSLGVPFKVSNPTGPVGTIDQDRQAGIAGFVGDTPDTTDVTSTMSARGNSRTGSTYVSDPGYLPDLAALGVVANGARVLDAITPGVGTIGFTISGTTHDGTPFTVQRENVVADSWDIAYMAPWELYTDLYRLQQNEFTAVDIDSIDVTGDLSSGYRRYSIDTVEAKQGSQWTKVTRRTKVVAAPGSVLKLRVTLGSYRDELAPRTLRVDTPVSWPNRSSGEVWVTGGNAGDDFFFEDDGSSSSASSFSDLVDQLQGAPRNDQVTATLQRYDGNTEPTAASSAPVGDVVSGHKYFRLVVRR